VEFDAAGERRRQEERRVLTTAWYTEALHRQEKLMPLAQLLGESARQTPAQQRFALQALSERYGIPLRKVKRKK